MAKPPSVFGLPVARVFACCVCLSAQIYDHTGGAPPNHGTDSLLFDRQTFDKVGVLVGSYAAGSYAEGDYEFTLPVTAALLRAVKAEYREAFSMR